MTTPPKIHNLEVVDDRQGYEIRDSGWDMPLRL